MSVYICAELGINHGGSLETACAMIDAAKDCGVDAVKLQKRTVAEVYTAEELARPRESIFGTTNGDLKYGLEFEREDYDAIAEYCAERELEWSASCWDPASVEFLAAYTPPWLKVPSACLTDHALLVAYRQTGFPLLVSTGMSTWEEIDAAMDVLTEVGPERTREITLLHCHAAYPSPLHELNLRMIGTLRTRYGVPIGYSSHSVSPWPMLAAVALGAVCVEFHFTLDRSRWGSDQSSSLEPEAVRKLVREVRDMERYLGTGEKIVYDSELPAKAKLRR